MNNQIDDINALLLEIALSSKGTPTFDNVESVKTKSTEVKKSSSRTVTKTSKSDETTSVMEKFKPWRYANLKKSANIDVTIDYHEISYKEQKWPVPSRTMQYKIELVESPIVAKNIATKIYGNDENALKNAYEGVDRYYEIKTYENCKTEVKSLGFISFIYMKSTGQIVHKIMLRDERYLRRFSINNTAGLMRGVSDAASKLIIRK